MKRMGSVLVKIWGIIYPPLIYLGLQLVLTAIVYIGLWTKNYELAVKVSHWTYNNMLEYLLLTSTITLVILFFVYRKDKKKEEKKDKKIKPKDIIMIIIFAIAFEFIAGLALGLLGNTESVSKYNQMMAMILSDKFILQLLAIGIVGPIVEEICFRGIMYNRLKKYMKLSLAVIIQAVLFGIVHMNIPQGIFAFCVGLTIVWIYEKTKNIIAPIIFHITLNTTAVLISHLDPEKVKPLPVLIAMIAIILGAIFSIRYFIKRKDVVEKMEEESPIKEISDM